MVELEIASNYLPAGLLLRRFKQSSGDTGVALSFSVFTNSYFQQIWIDFT